MATLLERLQSKLGQGSKAQFSDEASRAAELLRARTGKQVSARGPQAGSMAERIATGSTQMQLDQQQQAGQLAAEQLGTQQQGLETAQQQAMEGAQLQQQGRRQAAQLQEEQILNQFQQGQRRLDNARDAAAMEQVAVNARLENRQYIDNLQRIGAQKRLDSGIEFQEELQRSIFSDMESLLSGDLQFNELMAASDNEFRKKMADIDINTALQIAADAEKSARVAGMYSGLGTAASGAAQYAASSPADTGTGRSTTLASGETYEQAGPLQRSGKFSG